MNSKVILVIGIISVLSIFSLFTITAALRQKIPHNTFTQIPSPTYLLLPSHSPTPTLSPTLLPTQGSTSNSTRNPNQEVAIDDLMRGGPDTDEDGIKNIIDNCPFGANKDQKDTDDNGVGDICEVIERAKQDLAKKLGNNITTVRIGIAAITEKDWPSPCWLGTTPDQTTVDNGAGCAPTNTPGYEVTFIVWDMDGKRYLYHTDKERSFLFVREVK